MSHGAHRQAPSWAPRPRACLVAWRAEGGGVSVQTYRGQTAWLCAVRCVEKPLRLRCAHKRFRFKVARHQCVSHVLHTCAGWRNHRVPAVVETTVL